MSTTIKDEKKLVKSENGYIWTALFESEMSEEEFTKNKNFPTSFLAVKGRTGYCEVTNEIY